MSWLEIIHNLPGYLNVTQGLEGRTASDIDDYRERFWGEGGREEEILAFPERNHLEYWYVKLADDPERILSFIKKLAGSGGISVFLGKEDGTNIAPSWWEDTSWNWGETKCLVDNEVVHILRAALFRENPHHFVPIGTSYIIEEDENNALDKKTVVRAGFEKMPLDKYPGVFLLGEVMKLFEVRSEAVEAGAGPERLEEATRSFNEAKRKHDRLHRGLTNILKTVPVITSNNEKSYVLPLKERFRVAIAELLEAGEILAESPDFIAVNGYALEFLEMFKDEIDFKEIQNSDREAVERFERVKAEAKTKKQPLQTDKNYSTYLRAVRFKLIKEKLLKDNKPNPNEFLHVFDCSRMKDSLQAVLREEVEKYIVNTRDAKAFREGEAALGATVSESPAMRDLFEARGGNDRVPGA